MRLIDADALEKEIYKWMPKDQETWMDSDLPPIENLVVSIMMTIQEQPTVDAIPIEWIKEYIELQESYDTEIGDISGVGVREMLRYCAERKEECG